jgi:hypothetical protein
MEFHHHSLSPTAVFIVFIVTRLEPVIMSMKLACLRAIAGSHQRCHNGDDVSEQTITRPFCTLEDPPKTGEQSVCIAGFGLRVRSVGLQSPQVIGDRVSLRHVRGFFVPSFLL